MDVNPSLATLMYPEARVGFAININSKEWSMFGVQHESTQDA
jgi:hypothetical protein